MARSFQSAITVLNAVTRSNTADPVWVQVSDFRHMIFSIITSGNTTATIQVIGSIKGQNEGTTTEKPPSLASSASVTNQYAPIGFYDLNTATFTIGNTGLVLSGTDIINNFQVNTDGLEWVTLQVTAYTSGTISAFLKPFNDSI